MNQYFTMLLCISATMVTAQQDAVIVPFSTDTTFVKTRISLLNQLDLDVFEAHAFKGKENDIEIQYRLFTPKKPTAESDLFPLVIIFHGSGQVGTDNRAQIGILPRMFVHPDVQQEYPSYVLAPQFPTRSSDYSLDSTRNVLASTPRRCLQTALQLVDSLRTTLPIDPKRIYVVGYSMGASTTINALSARPDLFAAGVSIAGIPQFEKGNDIRHIPLWIIHGTSDDVNAIQSDAYFFQEFNRPNLRFWKLEGVNHDILTTPTILDSLLPDWLFRQIQP